MDFGDPTSTFLTFASTVAVFVASAIFPFVNAEVAIVALGTMAPRPLLPLLLVVATLSHMAGKAVTYLAGRGAERLPFPALQRRVAAVRAKLDTRATAVGAPLIFLSAVVGLPPFYLVTVASGVVRYPFLAFFLVGLVGRLLRFGALLYLPQLARTLGG